MLAQSPTTNQIVTAALLFATGLLLGLLVRAGMGWAVSRARLSERQRASWVLVGALEQAALAWLVIAGAYGAVLALPFTTGTRAVLGDVLLAGGIVAGTVAAARVGGVLARRYATRDQGMAASSSIFENVARLVVFILGGLVVMQTMGISIAPLLTALGVGGLAVALALQDTLSNLFAGLHVLASKKVVPGDYVRLDSGEEGYVVDINWRNTSLRTVRNNVILVPNARLASAVVTNFYKPWPEMSVLVEVGVAYGSNLRHVERVTVEVGRETQASVEGAVKDFEPLIRYRGYGEYSIDFNVILRVSEPTAEYLLTHEFVKRLDERYAREGIEIPFPTQRILPADGSTYGLALSDSGDGPPDGADEVEDRARAPASSG